MKKQLFTALFITILLNVSIVEAKIYQWQDAEGIDQFSSTLPPLSCKTNSCKKLHLSHHQRIKNNKRQIEEQKEQQELIVIEQKLKASMLKEGLILCDGYDDMNEYAHVIDARKFLINEKKCQAIKKALKYSYIKDYKKLSRIRVYLDDDSSALKWIESNNIIKPK